MSDLVLTVVAGPADRNSGRPRSADVLASLYVGGSGVWEFVALGGDAQARRLRIRAGQDDGLAVLAGVAVVAGLPRALETADRVLPDWRAHDLDAADVGLVEVAACAQGINVAAVVTAVAGEVDGALAAALHEAGWSVLTAAANGTLSRSQWS